MSNLHEQPSDDTDKLRAWMVRYPKVAIAVGFVVMVLLAAYCSLEAYVAISTETWTRGSKNYALAVQPGSYYFGLAQSLIGAAATWPIIFWMAFRTIKLCRKG